MPGSTIALELEAPTGYDLGRTLSGVRMGAYDPTLRIAQGRVELALRTPDGPAAVTLVQREEVIAAEGYGPGAPWVTRRLGQLCGLADRPGLFAPQDRVMSRLSRKFAGAHLPRSPLVFDRIIQVTLLQLVTWIEACRSWGRLVRDNGEPAPGPVDLYLPPAAGTLASTAEFELVALGIRPKQARTIRQVAKRAARLEAAAERGTDALANLLARFPGIGPWTVAYVRGSALADPDAVLLGDYNLPHTVAYILAGEPRADDRRMLELLEPYRGHRFRVIRLLWMNGVFAPRRGPRQDTGGIV
jgi:3-methyladenine DNA glycosylase/8-oxoguanine DNA glycosylase